MSMASGTATRIAMWSGPRNISTAMMRSFENRPDTHVIDEPFYGAYLATTGIDHPMCKEVMASVETDPVAIGKSMVSNGPDNGIFYQKHMTHHMLEQFPRDWISHVKNVFLVRDPRRVIASYAAKRTDISLEDLGFQKQIEIFDYVADKLGKAPPVIDSDDILRNPHALLMALCEACAIPFREEMLKWPAGPRASDGVWAAHWYGAVERSTAFEPPRGDPPDLEGELARLADEARPAYEKLHKLRLTA
jgi:hypothetical protein